MSNAQEAEQRGGEGQLYGPGGPTADVDKERAVNEGPVVDEKPKEKELYKPWVRDGGGGEETIKPERPFTLASLDGDDASIVKEAGWEAIDWRGYGARTPQKKKKKRLLNTATINLMANRMIAREWKKAKGKPKRDKKVDQLEREAQEWSQRMEMRKKKVEQKEQKRSHHFERLQDVIMDFTVAEAQKTKEERGDPDEVKQRFKEHLKWVGNPYKVEWSKEGCQIWYEPWEETRARQIAKITEPVIYTAIVDRDMKIASLLVQKKKEGDTFVQTSTEQNLADTIEKLLAEESLKPEADEIDDLLEQTITEVGRIISFSRTPSGWIAAVEPWDSMRVRNIEKEGEKAARLTRISIDQTNGKFRFNIYRL